MKINKKLIQELANCLSEHKLSELEYSEKDIKIKVVKNAPNEISRTQVQENKNENQKEKKIVGTEIKSPIIGTAYLAPEPGGKKFAEVGKKIKKGDTVMIIEAMKTMNDIVADKNGTIKEILVKNEQPVQFDDPLIIIE